MKMMKTMLALLLLLLAAAAREETTDDIFSKPITSFSRIVRPKGLPFEVAFNVWLVVLR